MFHLNVSQGGLEEFGVEFVEEVCRHQVKNHDGELFSNTTTRSTSKWREILVQSFQLAWFYQPSIGIESGWLWED